MTGPTGPIIRVEQAGLGPDAQVRLVVSGDVDLDRLRSVWVSTGAAVHAQDGRLHATTTVQALARAAGRAFGADTGTGLEAILRNAIAAWSDAPPPLPTAGAVLSTDARPLVMGVVNVTPDSFSEAAPLYPQDHPDTAIAHARQLAAEGADILDVGGESTRPGATSVGTDEELARVVPVVAALAAEGHTVSIDTAKPQVAAAALEAGAVIVNDVSGGFDRDLLAATAEAGAGYVLMHSRGTPQNMASLADYGDVVAEVFEFLAEGLQRCDDAGIALDRIVVDPGLGFAKTAEHNLALLRDLRQLRSLGRPVLVGASRKSFIGKLLDGAGEGERLEGSLACAAAAVGQGAAIVRVHDVAASVRVVRVARAIETIALDWPSAHR